MKPRGAPLTKAALHEERKAYLARRAIKDNDAMERAAKRSRTDEAIRRDKGGSVRAVTEADVLRDSDPPRVVMVPAYSTDIAVAWLVVEKLAADVPEWPHHGHYVCVHNSTGLGRWECRIGADVVAHADTAPLAICRAALAACVPTLTAAVPSAPSSTEPPV